MITSTILRARTAALAASFASLSACGDGGSTSSQHDDTEPLALVGASSDHFTSPSDRQWVKTGEFVKFVVQTKLSHDLELRLKNGDGWEQVKGFTKSDGVPVFRDGDLPSEDDSSPSKQGNEFITPMYYEYTHEGSLSHAGPDYTEAGQTREDGQRANGWRFSISTSGAELVLQTRCGRKNNDCCYHVDNACDDGLECHTVNDCGGTDCGQRCLPKPEPKPEPDPEPDPEPKPETKPSGPQCGEAGLPCCADGCHQQNTLCEHDLGGVGICAAPGDVWRIECECTDSFATAVQPIRGCLHHDSASLTEVIAFCGQLGSATQLNCAPIGTPQKESSGSCLVRNWEPAN